MDIQSPFPSIKTLETRLNASWTGFEQAIVSTREAEGKLKSALENHFGSKPFLSPDTSLVLCGSFARFEMSPGSDYDWSLLIDGVVDNDHANIGIGISNALTKADLPHPGSSGVFGNLMFSHDLVHRIGGGADSNINLTRRMLMIIESRPLLFSANASIDQVWDNTVKNILERYFEEDVHFAPASERKLPRFLLNDLTRYWRTICVDYAAKHRDQGSKKWAMRNAKLRFSRKLLYASGLAFCLACQLRPPRKDEHGLFPAEEVAGPFVEMARKFAETPPLEYLAAFAIGFVEDGTKLEKIADHIFGSYNDWLCLLADNEKRRKLEGLSHEDAKTDAVFGEVRKLSKKFANGLEILFFDHDRTAEAKDPISALTLEYIGF